MKQRVTVTLDPKLIAKARWLVHQRLAPSLGALVELGLAVVIIAIVFMTPQMASALERDTVDRYFREYDRVSSRVSQLSEELQQAGYRTDMRRVLGVLDQLATAREHLARYDAAHQLSALQNQVVSVDHSRLRALYYAYEAMAQMLSAQVDYRVTKAEPLRRLADRYRQTWQEADMSIHFPANPH